MFTGAKRLSVLSLVASLAAPAALAHSSHQGTAPHRDNAPMGTVYVTNRASAAATVVVDGVSYVLPSGRTEAYRAHVGDVQVVASVRVFGQARVLANRTVYVRADAAASVSVVNPTTALVKVENESDRAAELRVDGRYVASFAPDQTRVVSVPVGAHELAMVSGGWTFDRARMSFAPCGEAVFEAELPRVNDLYVVNPLPIPVEVRGDRGTVAVIDAYGQTVLRSLAVGGFHYAVTRLSGERVDELYGTIRPEGASTVRVDAPTTGLVDLHNDAPFVARVEVDGRVVRVLGSEDDARLELALGGHHIEVTDDRGRKILDRYIEVEPFDTERLVARIPERAHEDGHGRHEQAAYPGDRSDAVAAYDAEDHRHR